MNIAALTLRDLEYLIAVADHEHFGKAALAAHVSQPALSGQIKKVEEFLGVQLFERSNRRVAITAIGEHVVEQARVVLEEARKIAELVRSEREPLTGALRLGAISTLGPYYLPHVLAPLRKRFPQLTLHLREGITDHLLADLRTGTLEAVLASPTAAFDESLHVIPLFIEPFLLAAPKTHALAKKAGLRSLDLRASDMVLLEDGHCLKDQTLAICPANRRGNFHQYHATGLETLRHLVAGGLGYTLIPYLAAKVDPKLKKLICYRAFEGKPIGREIALVARKRFARMRDIEILAKYLKEIRPQGTEAINLK